MQSVSVIKPSMQSTERPKNNEESSPPHGNKGEMVDVENKKSISIAALASKTRLYLTLRHIHETGTRAEEAGEKNVKGEYETLTR